MKNIRPFNFNLFGNGLGALLFGGLITAASAEITVFNQNAPPDGSDLPGGGWGTYRGFSVSFDDAALDAEFSGDDSAPVPSAIFLDELVLRHPGDQGAGSIPISGEWTEARLKVYTTQTPTTASYVGDSINLNDMSQDGAERNVTYTFPSLALSQGTQYFFFFSNTAGNVDPADQTWAAGRLRVSNSPDVTYGSGNLINQTWGDQDTAFDAVFAATFASSPPSSTELVWNGGESNLWDVETTSNWELSNGVATTYANGDSVTFDDRAATGSVVLSGSPITPSDIILANDTLDYTLSGDSWGGPADLAKNGPGQATLLLDANHLGTTTISAGTLRLGDGGLSGTLGAGAVVNDASLVIERDGLVTLANPLSGSGDVTVAGPGTAHFSGVATHGGGTEVTGGTLRVSGTHETPVTVGTGAFLAAGPPAATGDGTVGSVVLSDGSRSSFRVGFTNGDRVVVTDPDGLTIDGAHEIDLIPTELWLDGDQFMLFDYTGNLGGNVGDLAIGTAPHGDYDLFVDTFEDAVIVEVLSLDTLNWTGTANDQWDLVSSNWELESDNSAVAYRDFGRVRFEDGAATGAVTLGETWSPTSLVIDNDALDYSFVGGGVSGFGSFEKSGPGTATWSADNSATGDVLVFGGTMTFGDGATSGEIGLGPVTVEEGATLVIDRSDFLDYKETPKLRDVAGLGDIVVTGGGTVFNYPGGGVDFAAPDTWSAFGGDLRVVGGSEFRTIRNGATAMGSGRILLGDESGGGALAPIEGNWTWTNDIVLGGPANRIVNRSGGEARMLKLQGVISGDGGLTFEDPAESMTVPNNGFILTAENTFAGDLTIESGVPVRVGGVPGDVPIGNPGSNADASGSLGSGAVINNGMLTFSRTDAHSLGNEISGTGELRVGLPATADLGDTSTQEITLAASQSYTGLTTILNGALVVSAPHSLASLLTIVEAGGRLAGDGSTSGDLDVLGTLAPGSGAFEVGGIAAFLDGSTYEWEINAWGGSSPGTSHGVLQTDTLDFFATPETPVTVVVSAAAELSDFAESAQTYTIASATTEITGFDVDTLEVDASGFPGTGSWSLSISGNDLQLSYAPGSADPYGEWAALNGVSGAGPEVDSDGDGVPNGIEFVIGGDPSGPDSTGLLPATSLGDEALTFEFRRTADSESFDPGVEYGSDLVGWEPAADGVNGVTVTVEDDFHGPGVDRVQVLLPRSLATDGRLFARLAVEIP